MNQRPNFRSFQPIRLFVIATLLGSLAISLFGLNGARPARAAGWVVNTLTDAANGSCSPTCTLRDAMTLAASGDTITFGVSGTITLGSTLSRVTKTLTVDGTGQTLTISGNKSVEALPVADSGNLTLRDVTVANGNVSSGIRSGYGGGLYN